MSSLAFVISPITRFTGFLHRNKTLISAKSRSCHQQRRIPIVNQNLYPDVDPPESIPNPLDQNKQQEEPGDSQESFLKKLNDRTAQNRVTDTYATTPDTSATEVESTGSKNEKFVDYSSATLAAEQPQLAKSNYRAAAWALWRLGWFTWWVQLILSVIAGVIFLFVIPAQGINLRLSASGFGFVVSGVGVFFAFVSLFWTYSYTRLSLWLEQGKGTSEQARLRINNRLRIGLLFSIAGLLVSLVGLQAIVGTLLARLYSPTTYTPYQTTTPGGVVGGIVQGTNMVQPVDILVVQGCVNAMMALVTALVATTWLRSQEKTWYNKANAQ